MFKGLTLTELIITVIVVGIMATFAIPQFAVTRERALDKEARAAIMLIKAAEKAYQMEQLSFYPMDNSDIETDTVANTNAINANLKISLPVFAASGSAWRYGVYASSNDAKAFRNKTGGRILTLNFDSNTITCDPVSDRCF